MPIYHTCVQCGYEIRRDEPHKLVNTSTGGVIVHSKCEEDFIEFQKRLDKMRGGDYEDYPLT